MASSAGPLSFADDKLKRGRYWATNQAGSQLTVVGQASKHVSNVARYVDQQLFMDSRRDYPRLECAFPLLVRAYLIVHLARA
jgi:hypothetical protein